MLKKDNSFNIILNFCFLFIIIPFLLASVAFAEKIDPAYEVAIARAVNKIEAADYEGAIKDLEEVLRLRIDDERATLYLGIALNRSGKKEAEGMLKRALLINPKNPRTNLELGVYYFNKTMYDEAKDYLENTINLAPKTALSATAEEYITRIKQISAEKRWSLNISVGSQYDSNVILNSNDNPLPQGISRKSDWRAVFYLKGRYNIVTNEKWESSIGYSLYQNLHTELSDFNVTQHLLELRATYSISPSLNLRGVYSFEYVFLGGDEYDYAHSISPALIISEGKGFSTIIEYRYRDSHFKDADLFVSNSDRTGSNNLIGITQNIPINSAISAKVGYSHDEDSTKKDFWDYKGDKGFMGIRFNMPYSIFLDFYGEYYRKDYDGINPISDSKRKDIINTYSGSATKVLTDRYSITIGHSYTRNKSSIAAYDYKRSITSFFLNARF